MGLNIKNAETEQSIRELAELTGQSLTGAIDTAVQAELGRIRKEKSREGMAERLLAIGRLAHAEMGERWWKEGEDPAAFLYDEDGLPK